ncbi:hypothetical protein AB0F13_00740 [Streptomyces sp. NPDC026206]|uniref:hypothetical protein n=1 Tax=Streptomyces sp. NPDC026206 TaxID=3157089 RepID=UPI0034002814
MNYWDADLQKWVAEPPPGQRPPPPAPGEPGHPDDSTGPEVVLGPPPPPGLPPAGPSHASILAGVLAGVVLAGGIGTGIWALVRDDDPAAGGQGAGPTAPVTPGPTDTSGASSGTSGSAGTSGGYTYAPRPTPSTLAGTGFPSRFVRTRDPAGFRLDVPVGWLRSTERTSVFYRSPDDRSMVQVFVLDPPRSTPYDSLVETGTYVSQYSGYRKLRLAAVSGPGNAAELEYTYTLPDHTTRHVVIHAYTAPDRKQYALLVAGPSSDRLASAQVLRALVDSFCPTSSCTS